MSLQIQLPAFPIPPSMNHLYPTAKHGRRFKNTSHPFFKEMYKYTLANAQIFKEYTRTIQNWKIVGFETLFIYRHFYFHRSTIITKQNKTKKIDVTNRIKVIDDELSKLLSIDDSDFWYGFEEKAIIEDRIPECVIIRIRPMNYPKIMTLVDSQETDSLQRH